MNTGWYVVYLIMCALNGALCSLSGFYINTWQFWAWTGIVIMSFITGSNYRKGV